MFGAVPADASRRTCNENAEEIIDHSLGRPRRLTPSQIGVILRDSHGVAQVAHVTGSKILRILKKKGFAPEITEDLYCLIKKAVAVRKHLDKFRQDKDAKFRLILIESRIHRVARYYKTVKARRGFREVLRATAHRRSARVERGRGCAPRRNASAVVRRRPADAEVDAQLADEIVHRR